MEILRNEKGETLSEFLAHYDVDAYKHPSCTVDMILMTVSESKLKVLLVKRRDHPFIGEWATPGGFIEFDEDMETAVQRELAEETHITKNTYFQQLYTFGKADRDPRTRVITTAYLSITPESNIVETKAGDDAADAAWFTISKQVVQLDDAGRTSLLTLTNEEKGVEIRYHIFDTVEGNYVKTRSALADDANAALAADHVKSINMAMDVLQQKAVSSGIIFNLLPEEVTMLEIEKAFEAIAGHKVIRQNFRRDIAKMLIKTENYREYRGRPVATYRFNPLYRYL